MRFFNSSCNNISNFNLWFLLCIIFFNINGRGESNLKFQHLTSNEGLSQNFISVILQDTKGFMWFGTKDGLNRYDGYNFKIYRHDPSQENSLSGNFISAIYEDSKERLWVGSTGLDLLNYTDDTFQRIDLINPETDSLTQSLQVNAITGDKKGIIWIGTNNGLFSYNPEKQIINKYYHHADDNNSISDNIIRSLRNDDSLLYVGTSKGLNILNLNAYSVKKPQFHNNIHYEIDEIKNAAVISQYRVSSDIFYTGTSAGLVKINLTENTAEHIPYPENLFLHPWLGRILSICGDKSGNLWLGSSGALLIFNPGTKKFQPVYHDPFDENSISFDGILSLHVNRGGKIWIGTAGKGINIYDQNKKEFNLYTGLQNKRPFKSEFSVSAVLCDINNDIWSVIGGELFRLKRSVNEYEEVNIFTGKPVEIYFMLEDKNKELWFSTNNGLFRRKDGKMKQYVSNPSDPNSLKDNSVRTLITDSKGNLWAVNSNYISRLNKNSDSFLHYEIMPGTADSVPPEIISVIDGYSGEFWIGWADKLIKFNRETGRQVIYDHQPELDISTARNKIFSLCLDPVQPQKYLWIGTMGGGLIRLNVEDESFSVFLDKDGLPNNVIYGMLPSGNEIWLSTNNGLSRVTTDKYGKPLFRNYDVSDGLQGNEFNLGAQFKSADGELFFGGLNGINAFYPSKIRDNIFVPPVVITQLSFLQKTGSMNLPVRKKIISSSLYSVEIPYSDNEFTVEFASLDYTSPGKNKYMYKLSPLNEEWIELDTRTNITFSGIEPGEYKFIVKGSNNDGIWNEDGAVLNIIVNPPLWRTAWAYSVYVILFLLMLYGIRKYELNRMKLKNDLKREFFEKQKLQELDEIRSGFFANISHEFRTPLTLIMGPAEQLEMSDKGKYVKEKAKIIKENAARLLNLINQILDISKIEQKKLMLNCTEGDVVSFIRGIVSSFSSAAEMKQLKMEFNAEPDSLVIGFDKGILEKIILNLISNAFKFTGVNGYIGVMINFKINAAALSSERKYLEIIIKDTGIGIPPEELENIFKRFYQIKNPAGNEAGTGIGLTLVKELTEVHGGKISVKSKLNSGSEFTILLPVVKSNNEQHYYADEYERPVQFYLSDEGTITEETEFISREQDENLLILIVEDDPDVRLFICDQLKENYEITTADNGVAGFEKAVNYIPDLIISDVMMPEMDGYKFCEKIKSDLRTSHIPVILLTARADEKDKLSGLKKGADDYLTKPFSSKELLLRIKNLIEIRQKLRKVFSGSLSVKPKEIISDTIDKIFIKQALKIVEENISNENFTVVEFSNNMNLSHSQLHRKLKALVNQSSNQFIRSVRMQRSLELLKSKSGSIAEIAYKVGYNDPGYFTKTFYKHFGYNPSEAEKPIN